MENLRESVRHTVRKVKSRRAVDAAIDRVRLRIDTFPRGGQLIGNQSYVNYQPLPWIGISGGRRAESSQSRWAAMAQVLDETAARSALDIGCNSGFFMIKLAERGIQTMGVEADPVLARTARYLASRFGNGFASVWEATLSDATVELLPQVDATVFLAVWHHMVRAHGLNQATHLLRSIWQSADKVMFFETGELDMGPEFCLPDMSPTPRAWLENYLHAECSNGTVRWLGCHTGFYGIDRNLFAVLRP